MSLLVSFNPARGGRCVIYSFSGNLIVRKVSLIVSVLPLSTIYVTIPAYSPARLPQDRNRYDLSQSGYSLSEISISPFITA